MLIELVYSLAGSHFVFMSKINALYPPRFFSQFNPWPIARQLWGHRDLIWQLTRREVGQRYRGSYLGTLWSLITPLAMLAVYTFVFSVIFRSRWGAESETPPGEYALILFAGLAAFNLFSEVIGRSPTLVLAQANYVKKVVFPLEILSVVAVLSALVNSLISIALVLVGTLVFFGRISSTVVLLPLTYVPLLLMAVGLSWFLASLGVYVRDIGQGIAVVVQMLFFVSPIFFPVSSAPEWIQPIYALNPLSFVLESFRQTLVFDSLFSLQTWGLWCLGTGMLAVLGYVWFNRTKRGFADVL